VQDYEKLGSDPYEAVAAVGGIAGWNLTAKNCWHSGRVSASGGNVGYAGGVAGYNNSGNINNCYHTSANGGVTAMNGETGNYAGGAAGYVYSGQITNCYWLGGTADAAVGLTDGNSGDALYCASFTPEQGTGKRRVLQIHHRGQRADRHAALRAERLGSGGKFPPITSAGRPQRM
jgi:hypothetical protein